MPLARIILSMSQRCSSKRRTRGGPRVSRMGGKLCCGRFMRSLRLAGRRYYRRGAWLVVNAPVAMIAPLPKPAPSTLAAVSRQDEDDPMKLAVPDMISNSYFPAEAAV